MKYELARDWKYSGGPDSGPDGPRGSILESGTVLGTIEINEGVPMTPQMLADAILRKLAREIPEESVEESEFLKTVVPAMGTSRKSKVKPKTKAVEDA